MTNEEYHSNPALSYSKLKVFRQDRLLYRDVFHNPKPYIKNIYDLKMQSSVAIELGTKFHTFLLEPEKMANEYITEEDMKSAKDVYNKGLVDGFLMHPLGEKKRKKIEETGEYGSLYASPKKTPAFKEYMETIFGHDWERTAEYQPLKPIITQAELAKFAIMKENIIELLKKQFGGINILEHKEACKIELPVFWVDAVTGMDCRTKIDILMVSSNGHYYLLDLKTIAELPYINYYNCIPSFEHPSRGYFIQPSFQRWAVANKFKVDLNKIHFSWLIVETNDYARAMLCHASEQFLEVANKQTRTQMRLLQQCIDTGDFGDIRSVDASMNLQQTCEFDEFDD